MRDYKKEHKAHYDPSISSAKRAGRKEPSIEKEIKNLRRLKQMFENGFKYFWNHPDKPWRHGLERQ